MKIYKKRKRNLIKILKEKIKENRGSSYLQLCVVVIVLMYFLSMMVMFLPIFTKIHKINNFSQNIARMISIEGEINSDVLNKIDEYKTKTHLETAIVDYSNSEFWEGNTIQLNDKIEINVTDNYNFTFLGVDFDIPIRSVALSRSEVYHK